MQPSWNVLRGFCFYNLNSGGNIEEGSFIPSIQGISYIWEIAQGKYLILASNREEKKAQKA